MRVYIAGPMRGISNWNFPAFHQAQEELEAKGFTRAMNPSEAESDEHGMPVLETIPQEWGGESMDHTPADVFKRDFNDLLRCRAIVLLPGWRQSVGAKRELAVARCCGLTVFELTPNGLLREIEPELEIRVVSDE